MNNDYNYNSAGFDNFLDRSVSNTPQANLDSPSAPSTIVRLDSSQLSGPLGQIQRFGLVLLDGPNGTIVINDAQGGVAIRIGDPNDPGQLNVPKGAIYIYDRDQNPTIINGRLVGSKTLATATMTTAYTTPIAAGVLLPIPGMSISFTIPDGVKLIKLTLYAGSSVDTGIDVALNPNAMYVLNKDLQGTDTVDIANALFTVLNSNDITGSNIPGANFWYISVTPGQQLRYYLAVSGITQPGSVGATPQSPLMFMAEIA